MEDAVATVLRQWQRVHPGMDLAPIAVIGRINRCAALVAQIPETPMGREDLSRPELDILCALRRVGGDLTPSQLARETFASGAAITKRMRHLEERGLVVRRADSRDRRVTHLTLTKHGQDLVDRVLPEQLDYESSLLEGLPIERQQALADILGELLLLLEGRLGGRQPS